MVVQNKVMFYVVLVVTILALMSQLMNGQLFVVGIFAVVAGITSLVNKNPTVIMLTGLIIAGLFSMIRTRTEGFEPKTDTKPNDTKDDEEDPSEVGGPNGIQATVNPPKGPAMPAKPSPATAMGSAKAGKVPAKDAFTGFRENFDAAKDISDALVKLSPMADTISTLLAKIPPDMIDKAITSFKARN